MENDITRRDFVTMSVAAGLAAAAGTDLSAQQQVVETNVAIKTAGRVFGLRREAEPLRPVGDAPEGHAAFARRSREQEAAS